MNNTLDFSHNWNRKLDCDYFTTLRISGRFTVGEWVFIYLKSNHLGRGLIVDKKKLTISQLNTFICGLDTGYGVEETKRILATMYKGRINEQSTIYLYLVRRENKAEMMARIEQEKANQTELFKNV